MISLRYTYNALQDFKIIRDANGNIDFPGEHFPPVHIFPEGKSDLSPAHVILYSNMGLVLTYVHTLQHRDPLLLYRHPCLKRCVCVGGYATCVCVLFLYFTGGNSSNATNSTDDAEDDDDYDQASCDTLNPKPYPFHPIFSHHSQSILG
jgi:hypothetical protein